MSFFYFLFEIDLTSGYIKEIVAQRSGDLQIENFMRPSARLLIYAMWPPEAHEFDIPAAKCLLKDTSELAVFSHIIPFLLTSKHVSCKYHVKKSLEAYNSIEIQTSTECINRRCFNPAVLKRGEGAHF